MLGMWISGQKDLRDTFRDFPLHILIDLVIHTTICATVFSIIYERLT